MTFSAYFLNRIEKEMLSQSILLIEYIFTYSVSKLHISYIKSLLTIVNLGKLWDCFEVLSNIEKTWVFLEESKSIDITLWWSKIAQDILIVNNPLNISKIFSVKVCWAEKPD